MDKDIEDEEEEKDLKFYCPKCKITFSIKDGTPLDDIMCPKCKTIEIFIELDDDEEAD